jgi:hypothetical protein
MVLAVIRSPAFAFAVLIEWVSLTGTAVPSAKGRLCAPATEIMPAAIAADRRTYILLFMEFLSCIANTMRLRRACANARSINK